MAPWSLDQRTEEMSLGDQELRMIPKWAMILAILAFFGMQYLFHGNIFASAPQAPAATQASTTQQTTATVQSPAPAQATPAQKPAATNNNNRRPRPNRAYWFMASYTLSTAVASYILLLGYVSRDAKRRDMSVSMWMLVSVVLPGGLGAVVYFLLRQPVVTRCPNCVTPIAAGYHFCPQCQFQVAPVCGICHRSVKITDVYCTQCGHDLAEDHAPARLRVYSDESRSSV